MTTPTLFASAIRLRQYANNLLINLRTCKVCTYLYADWFAIYTIGVVNGLIIMDIMDTMDINMTPKDACFVHYYGLWLWIVVNGL